MKVSVTISGIGMTPQGRSEAGPEELAKRAASEAMADAGIEASQVGMVIVANALGGALSDQECIRGQAWLHDLHFGNAPVMNTDNGCAGGASALHLGCLAVEAGVSPVLVVGVEKMWTGSRAATMQGIEGCLAAEQREPLRAELANEAGSIFMGLNAVWAFDQLTARDTTPEHFAAAAVKARRHGSLNPLAQHRTLVTMQEVLESTPIAGSLTRLMCSSFTDGAAAVVLQKAPQTGAPRIITSVMASGDGAGEYHLRMAETAEEAWKHASLGPADIDVIELHDATSAEEIFALETLGFFEPGGAGPATIAGDTTIGGNAVTVNPSGGLVARGHPLGATGICQVVEIAHHLRGTAGERQIEGARVGATVNTGGIITRDVASAAVHVLRADG